GPPPGPPLGPATAAGRYADRGGHAPGWPRDRHRLGRRAPRSTVSPARVDRPPAPLHSADPDVERARGQAGFRLGDHITLTGHAEPQHTPAGRPRPRGKRACHHADGGAAMARLRREVHSYQTQRFSPKRGAGLPDHLLSGDPSDLPELDLAQPASRLLTPELLSIGIYFPLKARDEPLRETGALPGREL